MRKLYGWMWNKDRGRGVNMNTSQQERQKKKSRVEAREDRYKLKVCTLYQSPILYGPKQMAKIANGVGFPLSHTRPTSSSSSSYISTAHRTLPSSLLFGKLSHTRSTRLNSVVSPRFFRHRLSVRASSSSVSQPQTVPSGFDYLLI